MKFNSFNQTKKSQRGVSLFDFVLWIAIAGVFIGLIYSIFGPSRAQVRGQAVMTEIQMAGAAITQRFMNDTNRYKDLSFQKLVDAKVLPTTMRSTDDVAGSSTEGGPVEIQCATVDKGVGTPAKCSPTVKDHYSIKYTKINKAACTLLLGNLDGSAWVGTPTCVDTADKDYASLTLVSN